MPLDAEPGLDVFADHQAELIVRQRERDRRQRRRNGAGQADYNAAEGNLDRPRWGRRTGHRRRGEGEAAMKAVAFR